MNTTVVNLSHRRADIVIDRSTDFGNPFVVGPDGNRAAVIGKFLVHALARLLKDPEWAAAVWNMRGKRLGCWCKPKECHGDVYTGFCDAPSSFWEALACRHLFPYRMKPAALSGHS